MRYQYILDGEVKFETDDAYEYITYLEDNNHSKVVMLDLLSSRKRYHLEQYSAKAQ